MSVNALPCPCCGSAKVFVCQADAHIRQPGKVECLECGLTTADFDATDEAVFAWNRRAPVTPVTPAAIQPPCASSGTAANVGGEVEPLWLECHEWEPGSSVPVPNLAKFFEAVSRLANKCPVCAGKGKISPRSYDAETEPYTCTCCGGSGQRPNKQET